MGRRIVKIAEHRDTNFKDMDALFYASDNAGLRLKSFTQYSVNKWAVEYVDTSRAREPKLDECRDSQDYDLRIDLWIKTCTVRSKEYDSFEEMVKGETKRLNEHSSKLQ
jgi:hypothetical protein